MAERIRRTVITITCLCLLGAGCAGRYARPRSLAGLGTALVAGGGATWVIGERSERGATTDVGFALLAVGLVTVLAAGGWMAAAVSCDADPDCDDAEQCREVPAPPGGIPYKQCVPR